MADNKTYIVETPIPNYCGIGAAGVQFANGKAEIKGGWVAEWYKERGYKVTEKGGSFNVDKATKNDLLAYAAENGIDIPEGAKVDDIRAAIKAAQK